MRVRRSGGTCRCSARRRGGGTTRSRAGVTNDVCTVFPTLTALEQGYRVQVVADAGGSMSRLADDVALRRMDVAGTTLTSTSMILTELACNWASPAGQALQPIVVALIPS